MEHIFSKKLQIAYAICRTCNNKEFIVSGQTQLCNHCGELLFRTDEKQYTLNQKKANITKKDKFIKNKLFFPQEIIIGYANCSDSANGEEVVIKDIVICQDCKERMNINGMVKYFLNDNNSK